MTHPPMNEPSKNGIKIPIKSKNHCGRLSLNKKASQCKNKNSLDFEILKNKINFLSEKLSGILHEIFPNKSKQQLTQFLLEGKILLNTRPYFPNFGNVPFFYGLKLWLKGLKKFPLTGTLLEIHIFEPFKKWDISKIWKIWSGI